MREHRPGPKESCADLLTPRELERYSRHLLLAEIGVDGQKRLKRSSILIVGAGGLGAPVSLYLTAAGVGRIGLVDFDDVEITNLHRQVLFGMADVGSAKLASAVRRLSDLNPGIEIVAHDTRLTSDNAMEIIDSYDVVVDGTDNFPARYLINDACVLSGKPSVYGSIFRFEGQVSVFGLDDGPCYRCVYPEPPPAHSVPNCAQGGVLGVLPGIIGCIQANEAIKLVAGHGETLSGRLLLFDALQTRFRELRVDRNTDCPVCGDYPTIDALIEYDSFCGVGHEGDTSSIREITPRELSARIAAGNSPYIIDVREPGEREFCNIGGHAIPLRDIAKHLGELPRREEIVVYCRSGVRSSFVVRYLLREGFANVANLRGGILAWSDEVDATIPKY